MNMKTKFLILLYISTLTLIFPLPTLAAKVSTKTAITSSSSLLTKCTLVTSTPENDKIEVADANFFNVPLVLYRKPLLEGVGSAALTVVPLAGAGGQFGSNVVSRLLPDKYYACSKEVFSMIQIEEGIKGSFSITQRLLLDFASSILATINYFAKWILGFFGEALMMLIRQGTFINHSIVKEAWPFIQGIANLGFIFVLLYIALATTLRMESIGTSVQRLLPKLLIGALLVNFSLIIGGLLIDSSRLLMAVEINLMGGQNTQSENFAEKLMQKTELINTQVAALRDPGFKGDFTGIILRLLQNTLFILLTTVAVGVIAINLFVRYIALLVLLIFSPIPYLAFILPNTKNISDQWWGMFLKWVLYGPIVLFFLIIITRIQEINVSSAQVVPGDPLTAVFFNQLIQFIIVIALFFVANSVGKKVAGIGSDAAMSFTKRVGSFARNNPKTALTLAGLATGGAGAIAMGAGAAAGLGAAQFGGRRARDFGKELIVKPFNKKFGLGSESIYDDKGQLKKGKSSIGTTAARSVKSLITGEAIKDRASIQKQASIAGSFPGAPYKSTFDINDLTRASFVAKLDPNMMKELMNNTDENQIKALAAAISKDKEGVIGKEQIKAIIDNADGARKEHKTVLKAVVQSPRIVNDLSSPQLEKILKIDDDKVTEGLLKSLASNEDKKDDKK